MGIVAFAKPDKRIVIGDALGHYVQLRSAVFDRDLRFRNDYARLYGLKEGSEVERSLAEPRLTATGHTRNFMPVGPALLWAPAFLLVAAGVWLVNLFGAGYPLDGYAPAFQAAAGFTGVAAAAAGNWLAFSTAARLFGPRPAIWATLALWLSSSAVYYSVISPTYSHAASMLAAGVFWLVWVRTVDRQSVGRYLLLGVLAGIAALMRWQDAILLLVPAFDARAAPAPLCCGCWRPARARPSPFSRRSRCGASCTESPSPFRRDRGSCTGEIRHCGRFCSRITTACSRGRRSSRWRSRASFHS
jgi:hypothetical protein